ncbi:hypothetical protein Amsp01_079350 [Amycolatopsis sp. NBRC 101858]|nr:hypothetical protein Amsp01_079350 [Amycolatopsis sp. NBRC 101858]
MYRRAAYPRYSAGRPVGAGAFSFRKDWENAPARVDCAVPETDATRRGNHGRHASLPIPLREPATG